MVPNPPAFSENQKNPKAARRVQGDQHAGIDPKVAARSEHSLLALGSPLSPSGPHCHDPHPLHSQDTTAEWQLDSKLGHMQAGTPLCLSWTESLGPGRVGSKPAGAPEASVIQTSAPLLEPQFPPLGSEVNNSAYY